MLDQVSFEIITYDFYFTLNILFCRCVIDNFKGDSLPEEIINLDSDSELEIEEPVQTPQHMETRSWYCECLKSIERKYPESFDEVVKNIMRSQSSKNTKTSLKNILGLLPSTSHGVGTGSSMFENLYSHHPKIRLAAVNYIVAKSHEIDISKNELLKNSILERLKDENPHVFKAVLGLKLNILLSIVSWPELQNILITTLNKSYKDPDRWLIAVPNALKLLCSSYSETDELKILCSIFPFLFPKHDNELHKVHTIIRSNFGSNCKFIKKLAERIDKSNNSKSICTHVFTFLEENDELNALHLIDILKESTDKSDVNKFISLLLLTSSLKKDIHVENSCLILEYALELLLDTDIKALKKTTHLNKDNLQLYISKCYKGVLPVDIFIYFLNGLIRSTNINQIQSLNLSNYNASSKFLISLFEILITGCSVTDNDIVIQYAHVINNFFAKYGSSIDKKCEFISYFFNSLNLESNTSNKNIIINSELQVRCLRVAKALLKKTNDCLDVILNSSIFLQNVLITLTNPIICIRKICMDIIQVLLKKCEDNNKEHYYLLSQLIIHKEEILLDHEQLPLVLFLILSPESDTKKSERSQKSEGLKLIYRYITDKNNPLHLSSAMLKIFSLVNSEEILNDASNLALDVLEYGKNNDKPLDNNRSLIIQNIIHRINKQTVKVINQNSAIWTFILKCLQYHNIHVTLGKEISNICKLLLDQIDNDIFLNIPKSLHASLISCVIDTATDSEMPTIISSASKFMKRIELDGNLIQNELQIMRDVKNPDVEGKDTTKRRSRRINVAPSPALLLTRQWKRGVTLLEFVQNKKKINDVENMLPMVFDVLKRCLEFDIQAPVEYTKQLLLSCILHCCNKLSVDQHKLKELPENIFNIELVVQCIRATSNPQTHHHALMLLCQMAEIVPEQVLHNMMAIFTFMGSSVLRHDDAYSFQIITKLIESVIPKLIEHSLDEMNEERATKLEKYIVPLLRVFVAVLLDVPEHRRIPLYKKLIDTLSPEHFLWLFLGLVFEAQVLHGENNKDKASQRRLDIASTLTREYPPNVIIHSCNKLLIYVKTLPIEKENIGSASINNALIFNYNYHTPKQLRHFKYTLITFVSGLISSPLFMNTIAVLKEAEMSKLETLYKTMIVNTLTLIQLLSKINDKNMGTPQSKYWKVMLHHAYDILDSVNGLLSADMFLLVIKGLMSHNLHTVRRKAMELLINRLQHNITFFDNCNKETLFGVLEPLTKVVETINNKEFMENGNTLEIEMNQQTALLAIKLLSKLLGPIQPIKFKPILILVTGFTAESNNIQQNVLSSVVLCLAELCNNLGSSAIENIPNIMPALINILKTKTKEEGTVELLLLSTITALQKIIECLALFLSPYLEKILYELAVLEYKFHQENQQNSQFQYKLKTISSKISSAIAPRVLIPAVKESYLKLIKKRNYNAIAFVMNTLSESFANISNADFTAHQKDLTNFFLDALQFRCEITEDDISESDIQNVEEHIFKAFVTLVLKLSESSFKPLYYRLFDWAATSSLNKNRSITFYRLSNRIAESLKGLFVLFAGCFINNACVLLDSCNVIKTDVLYFEEPEKCIILVESIMKTFYSVFLYDSQNFINKEKFEIIMQPLVDQLENNLGDLKELRNRARCVIIPCISQLAVASADDSLWKQLNYQVLLKTRHASSEIRSAFTLLIYFSYIFIIYTHDILLGFVVWIQRVK